MQSMRSLRATMIRLITCKLRIRSHESNTFVHWAKIHKKVKFKEVHRTVCLKALKSNFLKAPKGCLLYTEYTVFPSLAVAHCAAYVAHYKSLIGKFTG